MSDIEQLSPQEAAAKVDAGDAYLIDVRELSEWEEVHARQALHMPLGTLRAADVPMDKPLVMVCHMGGRSQAAAEALSAAGINVSNLSGGMMAWSAAELPCCNCPVVTA